MAHFRASLHMFFVNLQTLEVLLSKKGKICIAIPIQRGGICPIVNTIVRFCEIMLLYFQISFD